MGTLRPPSAFIPVARDERADLVIQCFSNVRSKCWLSWLIAACQLLGQRAISRRQQPRVVPRPIPRPQPWKFAFRRPASAPIRTPAHGTAPERCTLSALWERPVIAQWFLTSVADSPHDAVKKSSPRPESQSLRAHAERACRRSASDHPHVSSDTHAIHAGAQ